MPIARGFTYRDDDGEAIRLPREFGFGDDVELVLVRSGDVLTVYPAISANSALISRLRTLPAPPSVERRDDDPLPEPSGL